MKLNIPFIKEEDLPSLEKVTEGFRKIEQSITTKTEYLDIKKVFLENLRYLPQMVAPQATWNAPLYRTSCIKEGQLDIAKIETFSHPSPEICTLGRCNLSGFPVFYASISIDTALRERRKENNRPLEEGDEVYISYWQVKKEANLIFSQFVFSEDVEFGGMIKELNKANLQKLRTMSKPYSKDKQNAFQFLTNKLAKFFVSDNYNISSFLVHNILYDGINNAPLKVNAVLYPSIQANFNSMNFAIHPAYVKENLELKKVDKVRFAQFVNNGVSLTLLDVGIPNKVNRIEWFKPTFFYNKDSIREIELLFKNEPPESKFDIANTFFYNGKQMDLVDVAWLHLTIKQESLMEIISKFDEEMDFDKIYRKTLYINVERDTVVLKFEEDNYPLQTIKIVFEYKVGLQK